MSFESFDVFVDIMIQQQTIQAWSWLNKDEITSFIHVWTCIVSVHHFFLLFEIQTISTFKPWIAAVYKQQKLVVIQMKLNQDTPCPSQRELETSWGGTQD